MPKKKATLPLKERDIVRQVRDFMGLRGWRYIRMQRTIVPGKFQTGEPGMADCLFLRYIVGHGKYGHCLHLWCEFKSPTGRISGVQIQWHTYEEALGGCVWVVDDLDAFASAYEDCYGWVNR